MLTKEENRYITETDPGTPMGELFRRFWIPALLAEELPSPDCPPIRVRLLGEDLLAFKDSGGKIGLVDAHCPHRLADLFFGRNEECGLRCVYHGWKFDVNGECVDMPNEPAESNFKTKIKTTAYPCKEYGGMIWTYMGPKDFEPELPEFEWALVPDSHRFIDKYELDANFLQTVEGDIDNSHVSFLHSYLDPQLGNNGRITGPNYYAMDKAPRFTVKDQEYGIMIGARRIVDAERYHWHITHWFMPAYSIVGGPKPADTVLGQIRAPRDNTSSWFYRVRWNATRPLSDAEIADFKFGGVNNGEHIPGTYRPKGTVENDFLLDRTLQRSYNFTGLKGNNNQDWAVTISPGPVLNRNHEHLGTSDTAIIAMRRKLLRAAKQLQESGTIPAPAKNGAAYRIRSAGVILDKHTPFDEGARELLKSRV